MLKIKTFWGKRAVVVAVLVVLAIVGFVAVVNVADSLRYTHETDSLAGIWQRKEGNTFELRSDGTGRARANSQSDTMFFRWNERGTILTMFFEPRRKLFVQKVEQLWRGLPDCSTSHFRIDRCDRDVLVLYSGYSDTSFRFRHPDDGGLLFQDAPSGGARETEPPDGLEGQTGAQSNKRMRIRASWPTRTRLASSHHGG